MCQIHWTIGLTSSRSLRGPIHRMLKNGIDAVTPTKATHPINVLDKVFPLDPSWPLLLPILPRVPILLEDTRDRWDVACICRLSSLDMDDAAFREEDIFIIDESLTGSLIRINQSPSFLDIEQLCIVSTDSSDGCSRWRIGVGRISHLHHTRNTVLMMYTVVCPPIRFRTMIESGVLLVASQLWISREGG